MDVTPLIPEGRQVIQNYGGGGFKVSGQAHTGAVIVTPVATAAWDVPTKFSDLRETHFDVEILADSGIDILLLGCGAKGEFVSPALRKALKEKGLTVDSMDTGAACRTYNVLMAEGRRVAAALMPF
ncbi:MAG: hypothetical protein DI626_00130 [Micavibrio aeruginosavorus]|uniref:Uncharacterized protein n=1 Tax=Micavibrio aeruginosavorus TaxID=349221 RepID=A0A2W5A6T8_9BACT|nr:MAG: hypothetical protein DI626_00130 [Micavibrio aeruginosavorus]